MTEDPSSVPSAQTKLVEGSAREPYSTDRVISNKPSPAVSSKVVGVGIGRGEVLLAV